MSLFIFFLFSGEYVRHPWMWWQMRYNLTTWMLCDKCENLSAYLGLLRTLALKRSICARKLCVCVCVKILCEWRLLCTLEQGSKIVVEKRQKKWTKWSRQFHVTRYTLHVSVHIKVQVSMLLFFFCIIFQQSEQLRCGYIYSTWICVWTAAPRLLLTLSHENDKENRNWKQIYNVIHSHLTL